MNPAPLVCTIGDLVTDIVVHLDSDPQRGTDTPARIQTMRGGSAANVAVAAVAGGGRARFIGQVGDDAAGAGLIAELGDAGVEPIVSRRGKTGSIVVLVDSKGERSFLSDRGAAVYLSAVPADVLDGVDVLHVPMYSLAAGSLADTTQQLLGEAVERGIAVSLSTSSLSVLREYGRTPFMALVKNLRPEFIFANADEAKFLLDAHPWFTHAEATVVTAGGGRARLTRPDGTDHRVTAERVEVLDTTGAGDAFAAGFLVAWHGGGEPESWLAAGHSLAATTVTQPGAQLADPA